MTNYQKIYWLTRLDSLQGFLIGLLCISCIVLFVWYLIYMMEYGSAYDDKEDADAYKKNWKWHRVLSFVFAIISGISLIFIPSRDEAIMILAGGKTMDYIQSDTSLNKLPYQTTQIISEYLDKKIKDLKTDKK